MKDAAEHEVVVVDPLARPEWNALIAPFAGSTIFHSANWAAVLAESYGFSRSYFALFDGEALRGCLPVVESTNLLAGRRGVSVSFADHCGSLVATRSDFEMLFRYALEYGRRRGWKTVEFRGEPCLQKQAPAATFLHHKIELLPDEAVMHGRLRESTARNIRKAMREGVQIEFTDSREGVLEYYRLHCLTRKRHGVPPQPRRFFLKVHEKVIAQGLGFTALARHRDSCVAGIICLFFGRNAMYKYGASDETFQHLRANNLLLWETVRRCAREGFRSFSLGRTDLDNEGLLVFKNGWGAEPAQLTYHCYDLGGDCFRGETHRDFSSVKKMLRRMPIGVLRGLGALLYRYAG